MNGCDYCLPAGMNVLLVDQWIETGGTMKAAIQLVEKLGATVVGAFRCLRLPPFPQPSGGSPLHLNQPAVCCRRSGRGHREHGGRKVD